MATVPRVASVAVGDLPPLHTYPTFSGAVFWTASELTKTDVADWTAFQQRRVLSGLRCMAPTTRTGQTCGNEAVISSRCLG